MAAPNKALTRAVLVAAGIPTVFVPGLILASILGWNWQQGLKGLEGEGGYRKSQSLFPTEAKVTQVLDGDTIEVNDNLTVRMLGIDSPDRGKAGWKEATEYLADLVDDEKVRLVHLGRKDRLPKDVAELMTRLEMDTKKYNESHVFNIAMDYGGHDEIIRAINKIENKNAVTAKEFEQYLDTRDQPYPNVDLFIRTSGEQRTSGLLPWQMDYAEYYFEPDHLPDFGPEKLKNAILDFSRRRRRFGGNDAVEHFKFDPKLVARLEMDFRRDLTAEKVAKYVREQYGMTKELAKEAGGHLVRALRNREEREWVAAKDNLSQLYEIVRKNVGLALEPEVLANIEVKFWRDRNEENMKELLAEKFRFSTFQAAKSAHLAVMAEGEADPKKQKGYLEMFYKALKERVA